MEGLCQHQSLLELHGESSQAAVSRLVHLEGALTGALTGRFIFLLLRRGSCKERRGCELVSKSIGEQLANGPREGLMKRAPGKCGKSEGS